MRAEHPIELVVLDFAQRRALDPGRIAKFLLGHFSPPLFATDFSATFFCLVFLFFPLVSDFFSASLFFATTYDPPDFPDFLSRSIERIEWAAWAAWLITCFCTRSR